MSAAAVANGHSSASASFPDTSNVSENSMCPGCHKSVVNDSGGVVVAFGQSFFHVQCFKCAKCGNQVNADTNLLLLSDGSPICSNCSYNCNVCHLPILDEAIMTGDDAYHAHCFKCRICKNLIDDMVFAKTSQGIYCMKCHNERVARNRRHAERKKEQQRERERELQRARQELERLAGDSPATLKERHSNGHGRGSPVPFSVTVAPPDAHAESYQSKSASPSVSRRPSAEASPSPSTPGRSGSLSATTPTSARTRMDSLPLPSISNGPGSLLQRRKSRDDSALPVDISIDADLSANIQGLNVPNKGSSRADKRRSINPGLGLSQFTTSPPPTSGTSSPTTSTHTITPPGHSARSEPQPSHGRDSPRTPSPLREYFNDYDTSHPSVNGNSQISSAIDRNVDQYGRLSPSTLDMDLLDRPTSRFSDRSRPTSPASPSHRVDVPHGVESGTDTEAEGDSGPRGGEQDDADDVPPALPPKDAKDKPSARPSVEPLHVDTTSRVPGDISRTTSAEGSVSDDEEEPVQQRMSTTTFIAPALPPIRISMNMPDFDFSDLLKSIEGSSRSSEPLSKLAEEDGKSLSAPTPPPTAASSSFLDSRSVSQPSPTRARSSSESGYYSQSIGLESRSSLSTESAEAGHGNPRMTLTVPGVEPVKIARESEELVTRRLQEVLLDANERNASHVKLDKEFVEAIYKVLEQKKTEQSTLKGKLNNIQRASQQYMDGLTVAQAEYDREVKARREAESEVTRLRVLLSGQAARLSAITSESKRAEMQRQLSEQLSNNLSGLERDVSKLKVERDLTLAEVEELSASKSSPKLDVTGDSPMSRTLSVRFDNIKSQYARELVPLTEQKEALNREIAELKALREQFMEETASLSARNEELAQLNHQYIRQMESVTSEATAPPAVREKKSSSFDRPRTAGGTMTTSITTSSTLSDDSMVKISTIDIPETPQHSTLKPGKFKWPGSKVNKEAISASTDAESNRGNGRVVHNFVPLSTLRFARCDHCGDKMFGSQHRCSNCNISVHPRCVRHVQTSCNMKSSEEPAAQIAPLPPSMFGRDLIEQVQADSKDGERSVPIIVEKCIAAVEASALDLEGIYRKTGGSGQSKMITQLFEKGDYSFDLRDSDRFNDICSVTSVLKSYFRSLPNPLLTYSLHDEFVAAAGIRDPEKKLEVVTDLLAQLPHEHFETLKMLMLHLHRVMEHSEVNLMSARNIGVVFGPTLMRSSDPSAEFSDMGAKAMSVEWLVENAPAVFASFS
ncbi:RhoGAP-domain-containing protein [Gloeophyllum trabeum ATCC 11539]|uniref:RhoGAP-domain-containing protein n=1 Tax=Gloeophyllum trabeum (strain ATCC 11539 / FP-39264 / Madison 617) TaxID=670483 RepID=S7QCD5_GLOTA|nr:RhoGAP-domain-containing protein [Gloeophyllum trabeum ATCC 11539]EPQ56987.1 RhoGAP-domain-containing protein [Gloeophyllum trabeum ATCC 11539]